MCRIDVLWILANSLASSKGCFMPSTPVSLADGTQKELRYVTVGESVSSWDQNLGRSVNSTVVAVPTFRRRISELVEVALPSAFIYVTHDHPFWSGSRRTLVSSNPNQTQVEYNLQAQLLVIGEELEEEESQRSVSVVGLRRLFAGLLSTDVVGSADEDEVVDVITLCLEPFHWYYVHGVRVHNKGCFAPWTPVLMSDHTQKPISEVREKDKVIAWDENIGQTSVATVLGVLQFPASNLLEINFNLSSGLRVAQAAVQQFPFSPRANPWPTPSSYMTQLLVTHDHPVYSARARSVVSMNPNKTSQLYGLSVGQMQKHEVLHDYLGHDVHAQVQEWNGSVDIVMTLQLDWHHWFYVHGVRVHNKGGGGGFSGRSSGSVSSGSYNSGGSGGSFRSSTGRTTRSSYSGNWYLLVAAHGRRRGMHDTDSISNDEDECTLKDRSSLAHACHSSRLRKLQNLSGLDGIFGTDKMTDDEWQEQYDNALDQSSNVYSQVLSSGGSGSGGTISDFCNRCLDCADVACINSLGSACQSFLDEAYEYCELEGGISGVLIAIIVIVLIVVFAICCLAFSICSEDGHKHRQRKELGEAVANRKWIREEMPMCNSRMLGPKLMFAGTYTENGETKPTSYNLTINSSGELSGQAKDDDGIANCTGKLHWVEGASHGDIAWSEAREGVLIEAAGDIIANDCEHGTELVITANYNSTYQGTTGSVHLTCVNRDSRAKGVAPISVGRATVPPGAGSPTDLDCISCCPILIGHGSGSARRSSWV